MSKAQVEQSVKLKKSYRNIRLYEIEQVKEESLSYPVIKGPEGLFEIASLLIGKKNREHFLVIALSTKHEVIGTHVASVGTINSAAISPAEVFKFLLLTNAAAFAVAHNHPSGNLLPSTEDINFTHRLAEAGHVMGVALLDHLIISEGDYYSMKQWGDLPDVKKVF